jgi:DNA-binding NarL/FixJ family response regulator
MRQATGEEKEAPQKLALSELDLTILRLLSTGQRNKQIGPAVGLSEKTVRNHLSQIFAKLGVQTRTEAAVVFAKFAPST